MQPIQALLKDGLLIFDGAMGTYARLLPDYPPEAVELACLTAPQLVSRIHREYLEAGCRAIKTNTFSVNRPNLSGDGAAAVRTGAGRAIP